MVFVYESISIYEVIFTWSSLLVIKWHKMYWTEFQQLILLTEAMTKPTPNQKYKNGRISRSAVIVFISIIRVVHVYSIHLQIYSPL